MCCLPRCNLSALGAGCSQIKRGKGGLALAAHQQQLAAAAAAPSDPSAIPISKKKCLWNIAAFSSIDIEEPGWKKNEFHARYHPPPLATTLSVFDCFTFKCSSCCSSVSFAFLPLLAACGCGKLLARHPSDQTQVLRSRTTVKKQSKWGGGVSN